MKSCIVHASLAAALLVLGPPAQAEETTSLRKITIGDVAPIAAAWPQFVAQDQKLFEKHGLDATVTYVGSAANAVQQLVGGAYDVGLGTFDTALRAAGHGARITVLGTPVVKYPYSIIVAPDIRNAADLKGKTIILPFQKDIATTIWNHWLRDHGVEPKSVDQVYDGATPNRFAALSSKAVQAAFLGSPFEFKAEKAGFKKLFDFGDYAKGYPFTAVVVRRDWLAANRDVAQRYVAAMADAIDFLYNPANKQRSVEILANATKQDSDVAGLTYDYYVNGLKAFSRGLTVPDDAVATEAAALVEMGDLKSAADVPAGIVEGSGGK